MASSSNGRPDPALLRERLRAARLYLLFTPELCAGRDPLKVLEAALPWVDLIQVRPKASGQGLTQAREAFDWSVRVLDLLAAHPEHPVPVLVNDRVDVARALEERGCAGVHLGQDDASPEVARRILGEAALIGLSTHSPEQVAAALEQPVDYLGFGPVHGSPTKGYERGLGAEAAWIASQASDRPLFPIGGIGAANAGELERIGRAAVSASILAAPDSARAARELRALLESDA